jgi:hypothetical protein
MLSIAPERVWNELESVRQASEEGS